MNTLMNKHKNKESTDLQNEKTGILRSKQLLKASFYPEFLPNSADFKHLF